MRPATETRRGLYAIRYAGTSPPKWMRLSRAKSSCTSLSDGMASAASRRWTKFCTRTTDFASGQRVPLCRQVGPCLRANYGRMRIYISADMEGVAGITAEEQTNPVGQPEYAYSCMLMTGEVRAACEGAADAGATSILVNDSHWNMRNIIHEELPPDVRLIRGNVKPLSMNQGLEGGVDYAAFVGYHASG